MPNLTEKYIKYLEELRESKIELSSREIVNKTVVLSKLIKREKGIGDLAITVADYIVVDGMSYEEALAEAEKDD